MAFFIVLVVIGGVFALARPPRHASVSEPSDHVVQTDPPVEEETEVLEENPFSQGFVFPNSDLELIDQWEVEALSDSDLTYAINEIYARHGYIFRSNELREYYEQFSWYVGEVPSDEFSVDCFNQIEQQNWALLVGERDRRRNSS